MSLVTGEAARLVVLRPALFAAFLAILAPPGDLAQPRPSHGANSRSSAGCRRIELTGEVEQGHAWKASIGEGWSLRVVPVAPYPDREDSSSRPHARFSGWDLVVSPEGDSAYPDALLLATPPYGSINQREIATTFGLRAQDAIAWTPRHFRFLTTMQDIAHARELYRTLLNGAAGTEKNRHAAAGLLALASPGPRLGSGEFSILDARLVPGSADPPEFAQQWAAALPRVPHTYLPVAQIPAPLGDLRSMRFRAVLRIPASWRPAPGLQTHSVKCAE